MRAVVEVLRAGATTTVASFELHDDATGRPVGGGTATGRPFPFDFDRSYLDVPIGTPLVHGTDNPVTGPISSVLGLRVHEDASVDNAEKWAARIPATTYAIDDQTAIKVVDGALEVVSEGCWKVFNQ